MAWTQGVNFRGSSGYASDGASTGFETATSANYTGSRTLSAGDAVGIGWEDAPTLSLDRDNSIDNRIRGAAFVANSSAPYRYRIDLPSAGDYTIAVAAADGSGGTWDGYIELFDDTASLGVLCSKLPVTSGKFVNAADAEYAFATTGQIGSTVTKTFASTICRFKCGKSSSGTTYSMISHILMTAAAAAAASLITPLKGRAAFSGLIVR